MIWKKRKVVEDRSGSCDSTSIGNLLLAAEIITRDQLEEALKLQEQRSDERLGQILVELGYVNREILEYFFENQSALRNFDKEKIQKVVKFAARRNKSVNTAFEDLQEAALKLTTKLEGTGS